MLPSKVFEQDPTDTLDYYVDFTAACARVRKPNFDYPTGTRVRPAKATGFQYNASTGGHTATSEPRWPTTAGGTVTDGSVVWTAEAVSTTSLERQLSSAAWTPDSGLTKAGESTFGTIATANLSAGTLGQSYLVRVAGTMSDGTVRNVCFGVDIVRPRQVAA
jgi:hypothetical protein